MKTAADNKTIRLDINADMDASDLDALLHKLALERANMTPAIPNSKDAAIKDDSLATIEDGQSAVIARRRNGGFRLWLRHSGFGWLTWGIDDRFASGIANYIAVNVVEAEKINLITHQSGHTH